MDKHLVTKPCKCGHTLEEVIGYNHRVTDDTYQAYRVGWYCKKCHNVEQAVLREREVDTSRLYG